jgi:hypothetical protein
MSGDPYGCRADAEHEEIDELERAAHEDGSCEGYPRCGYCCDERDREIEEEKSQGRYDWWNRWVRD